MIHTDQTTISDHGMIVACMAVLKESGMTRQDAVPIYQKLLDHHGLTADAVARDLRGARAHLPTSDIAKAHLLEVCLEQVEREREKSIEQDPMKYVEQIRKMSEEKRATLLSNRGTYSKDRIRYEFGLPDNLARAVAAGLSIQGSKD